MSNRHASPSACGGTAPAGHPSTPRIGRAGVAAVLAVCAVCLVPATAATVDARELVTDRPDFTESAVLVPAGLRQLEGGYTLTRSGGVDHHALGELLLRYGMSRRLELRAALTSYTWQRGGGSRESELADAGIGVKLALAGPELESSLLGATSALIVATSVPVRHNGSLQPEAKLLLAWDLAEAISLSSNLNAARPRDERGAFWEMSASTSLGLALTDRLGAYLEAYGFAPLRRARSGYLDGGVTVLLNPLVQLDLRAGTRVDSPLERFLGLGFALRW